MKPVSFPRARVLDCNRLAMRLHIGSFTVDCLGWGFIEPKWWRNYLHVHSYYEVCYAFAGKGTFRREGVEHPLRTGDVFVARPQQEHEIIADRKDPLGIYFWSYTLVPDAGGGRDEPVDRLLHAFVDAKRCVSDGVPGMGRTLELLTEEMVRAQPGHVSIAEGLVRKLILDTARSTIDTTVRAESVPTQAPRDPASMVEMVKRYVRDNLARSLTVGDLATQVAIGERHLTRLFQRACGISPGEFIIRSRIEAAEQLLLDPALPVKSIAAQVGYPNVRHFTTLFRRRTGYPPATWRLGRGTSLTARPRASRRFSDTTRHLQVLRESMDERAERNHRGIGAGRQSLKNEHRRRTAE